MNEKLIIRIAVDICMTAALLLLMPYSLLSETAHEWIGMAMFILFVLHHLLNRKWISSIMKGKYTSLRVVQTILAVIMFGLMIGSMVSGILLSNHIFKAVRIAGTSTIARQVHMFCAYWGLVVMSIHIGIHWNMAVLMMGRLFKNKSRFRSILVKGIAVVMACYGVYAFHKRQIGLYLLMKMHFVFYNYSESVAAFMADYMMVMVSIAFVTYYISMMIKNKNLRSGLR